jgi:hypothetical protein
MTIRTSSRATSFLLAAVAFNLHWNQSMAFAPSSQTKAARMASQRFVSTIYSDFSAPRNPFSRDDSQDAHDALDAIVLTEASALPTPITSIIISASDHQGRLSKMEIPSKHAPTANQIESAQFLVSMEMTVGRAAMLVAVLFMATELTTGMSLPQQLALLVTS